MADYRVKGAFFENDKPGGPAFTGFVEIDGVKTMLALWPKNSAKGQNYLQVSEDKKKNVGAAPAAPPAPKSPYRPKIAPAAGNAPKSDMDDDEIPF